MITKLLSSTDLDNAEPMDKPPFSRQKIHSWGLNKMKPVKSVKGLVHLLLRFKAHW